MLPLDPDQARYVIERGHKCAALLENEAFVFIVNDLTQYHLAALVAAPPGPSGAEAVAHHHQSQSTLTELVATLTGYVEAGNQQREALDFGDPEEPDTNDR